MSDAEEPIAEVPSTVVEAAAVPVVEDPAKPKERIKKPQRPDDATHKQKVEALQATINKNKQRSEEIKQALDDRRKGRGSGSTEQQAIKTKLTELRSQFQTLLKQKQHFREQLDVASKARDAIRISLKDLKSNMKFTTVEAIDDAVDKLEHRVQHSSLSLNEEKQILDDIRKLKASRSAVGEYSAKLETLASDDSSRSEVHTSIKSLDEELNKIRAKEDVLRAELASQREKDQESNSDIPAMIQEREECREVAKQAYEKIKDIRAEHDLVWQEFKAQEKVWRVQQDEERAIRRKEAIAERAIRDAERAVRLAEMAPEPFDKEITVCDQLTAYLGRFVATKAPVAEEIKGDAVASIDGMKMFKRDDKPTEDDDLGAYLAGNSGKGKKKGKKTGGDKVSAGPEKLVHSLDMLNAFATLSISVPTSAAAVPEILSDVESKKKVYLQKREESNAKAAEKDAPAETPAVAAAAVDSEVEEGEIVETSGGDKQQPKKKSAKKAATSPAALKLDDVASWPAVGAAAGAYNGNGDVAEEAKEEEEVEEAKKETEVAAPAAAAAAMAAAPVAKKTIPANGVAVELKIRDGEGISLAISHSDD